MTSADAERIATQHSEVLGTKVQSLRNVMFIDTDSHYRFSFMKQDPYYLVFYNRVEGIFDDESLCLIVNAATGEARVYETL